MPILRRKFLAVPTLLVGCAAVAACSSDAATTPALIPGPPDLRIASLSAPGIPTAYPGSPPPCFPVNPAPGLSCPDGSASPACNFVVALATNPPGQIPLILPDGSTPEFWTFEPPNGCAGAPYCGYALLLIGGLDTATGDRRADAQCDPKPGARLRKIAAGPTISVSFEELREALAGQYGPTRIRVELWPGEGTPDKPSCAKNESGLWREAKIDFEPSCGSVGVPDGGFDAGPHDASTDTSPDAHVTRDAANDREPSIPDARPGDAARPVDASDASAESGAPKADAAPPHDAKVPTESGRD